MVHLLQVSDSHLSPAAPYADENWAAVVEEVRRRGPDLVVHTGDVSLDGANDLADLLHARRLLDELPVPWLALPGNHDIGDVGGADDSVDADRRRRYHDVFGDGSWVVVLDGWRLVGVDVQTLASPLAASGELWAWLEGAVAGPEPIALFLHRPLHPLADGELDDPIRYVPEPTRGALLGLIDRHDVRLIGSGHVHQWRQADHDGRLHVWAPSTWASLPDYFQPRIGAKTVGIVEIDLVPQPATFARSAGQERRSQRSSSSKERTAIPSSSRLASDAPDSASTRQPSPITALGALVTATLVQPAGVADVTIVEDFDLPYHH